MSAISLKLSLDLGTATLGELLFRNSVSSAHDTRPRQGKGFWGLTTRIQTCLGGQQRGNDGRLRRGQMREGESYHLCGVW
jgi:hypothetical protein